MLATGSQRCGTESTSFIPLQKFDVVFRVEISQFLRRCGPGHVEVHGIVHAISENDFIGQG